MFSTKFDKETQVWSGKAVLPTFNPKVSVAQVILATLSTYGSKIAQVTKKYIKNSMQLKKKTRQRCDQVLFSYKSLIFVDK